MPTADDLAEESKGLFLTALIKSGEFSKEVIRNKCKVERLPRDPLANKCANVNPHSDNGTDAKSESEVGPDTELELSAVSYSGYFTVDESFNSNLFFWFFPSEVNEKEAPLLLWLNGGPGSSSMKGVFVEHGPFLVNPKLELEKRDFYLAQNFSIVYVDSPVGAGFSFTQSLKGRATSMRDIDKNLLEFLDQFFDLFPEFLQRDFYICGESFGGKFVPSLGEAIHLRNQKLAAQSNSQNLPPSQETSKEKIINLKGLTIGSPYTDPINQTQFGEFLYNAGLIDGNQRGQMQDLEEKIKETIRKEKWPESLALTSKLILGIPNCLFTQFSGYTDNCNILERTPPPKMTHYIDYIQHSSVRSKIHAGQLRPFNDIDLKITLDLTDTFFQSQLPSLQRLLVANYKILIYSSQLDILVPAMILKRVVEGLRWQIREGNNSSNFYSIARSPRKIWKLGRAGATGAANDNTKVNSNSNTNGNGNEASSKIVGYVKQEKNLTFVEVLEAGHLAFVDVPQVCCEMMERFIMDKPFS